MAQVSDYGWCWISSSFMILVWITRNPKRSNSCVIIGLIDGGADGGADDGDKNVCAHVINLQ